MIRRLVVMLLMACAGPAQAEPTAMQEGPLSAAPTAWQDPLHNTVEQAFPPPAGARRVPTDAFGAHLRTLPLRPVGTVVHAYDGREIRSRVPVRVVDLPLAKGNLQQCADAAIRVRAQWLEDTGQDVAFHATSGDLMPWSRVQRGEVPHADGAGLVWKPGRLDWEGYLRRVFMWAGTDSLERLDTVAETAPRGGDVLVQGGFPGHAVLLLDVARDEAGGTWLLVAQSYMPAQDFHILVGPEQGWWRWQDIMVLPSWTFRQDHLRRWRPASIPSAAD